MHVHCMYTACALHVHCMCTACAPQAARRWGMNLLTMQGMGHTDGIVACIGLALFEPLVRL